MPLPKDPVDRVLGILVALCFGSGICLAAVCILVAMQAVAIAILKAVL
jgi:hypothetical protein